MKADVIIMCHMFYSNGKWDNEKIEEKKKKKRQTRQQQNIKNLSTYSQCNNAYTHNKTIGNKKEMNKNYAQRLTILHSIRIILYKRFNHFFLLFFKFRMGNAFGNV